MKNKKIKQKETTDIYRHDFNEVQFESELHNTDWKSVLEINKKDVYFSSSKFFQTFASIKKLSNKDKKTMKKHGLSILKSIEKKN